MAGTPSRSPAKTKTAKAATRKPAKKPASRKKAPTPPTAPPLAANGFLLISVFGPFGNRALVEMSAERAQGLFEQPLSGTLAPTRVIDATAAEIATLVKRAPALEQSALAASAIALAYQIENPFNSATSKSMCARELRETMSKLRELAPPAEEEDGIDELSARRAERRTKPPTRRRRSAP